MNKFLLSASAVAALSLGLFADTATAQSTKPGGAAPAAAAAPSVPHKVALIDMAYVFKNYKKFENLREDLKAEVKASEEEAMQKAEQLKQLQAKLKTFNEGSPEFDSHEKQLAKLSAEFETFRRSHQREFLKKESQIYHTVYMDVSDVVAKYANYYNFTLVIRFNREDLDTENAQKLIEGMNRQVVFHRPDDDITDPVTKYLNDQFDKNSGGVRPASGTAAPRTAPAQTTTPRTNAPR